MEHVHFQIPNEHRRVWYLLTTINCVNSGLQVAMTSIKTNNNPTGLRNNFEAAALHLIPYNPVQKKHSDRTSRKRNSAEIYVTKVERVKV